MVFALVENYSQKIKKVLANFVENHYHLITSKIIGNHSNSYATIPPQNCGVFFILFYRSIKKFPKVCFGNFYLLAFTALSLLVCNLILHFSYVGDCERYLYGSRYRFCLLVLPWRAFWRQRFFVE